MALATTVTVNSTTATKRVGCVISANMRSSTKGTGEWCEHRVVWTVSGPVGWTYTCTDPRPGLQQGTTMDLAGGDFEGYSFALYANVAGDYDITCTITDKAGTTSADTATTVTVADDTGYTTYTLKSAGGDYSDYGAAVAAINLAGGDVELVVSDGTFTCGSDTTIDVDNVWVRWDGIGSKPVFQQSVASEGLAVLSGQENVTFYGIDLTPLSGSSYPEVNVKADSCSDIGVIDCVIRERDGAATSQAYTIGILYLNCTVEPHTSGSVSSPRNLFAGQATTGTGQTTDFCIVGVTAGNQTYQTERAVYDIGSLGFSVVASKLMTDNGEQSVRFRRTRFGSLFRNYITSGTWFSNEGGAEALRWLDSCVARRNYITTEPDEAVTVHCLSFHLQSGDYTLAGVTPGDCGWFSNICVARTGKQAHGKAINSQQENLSGGPEIISEGNTVILDQAAAVNTVPKALEVTRGATHRGELVIEPDGQAETFGSDSVNCEIVEGTQTFGGSIDDCVFVSGITNAYQKATTFYGLAGFNALSDVSSNTESSDTLGTDLTPPVGVATYTTSGAAHEDYYGNAVAGAVKVGAVQSAPTSTSVVALSAGGSFLVIGV